MRVSEVRQRVLQKVASTTQAGDEEATAQVMEYARAVLVAVASLEDDTEVDLERLTVGTATAACILSFHQEYVRDLARRNALKATKENGEYRIRFPDLIESLLCARRSVEGMTAVPTWLPGFRPASLRDLGETSYALWRHKRRSKGKDQEA